MDVLQVVLVGVLLSAGVLFVYGAGQQIGGRFAGFWLRQVVWIAMGGAGYIGFALLDYRRLGGWSWLFYLGGVLSLVAVLFWGQETNQARSWLRLPVVGRTIQPAELCKPACLLFSAWLASRRGVRLRRLSHALPVLATAVFPVLLIGLQPDWGTALIFVPMVLMVVFVGGLSWRWILVGVVVVVLTAPVAYTTVLGERQRERIRTFVRPPEDISDAGWNVHQSLLAVGSGGFRGKGFMQGTQHVLGYLPQNVAPTDFIFSVVAEESGFIGASAMALGFLGLILCSLRTAGCAADDFGAYFCAGAAAMLFAHAFINMGMTVRVAPIIGIPLPLVSYGGSFMLTILCTLGLVQSVHVRRTEP